jgi:hypothetical protein
MTFERAIHAGTAGLTPCKCGSESLHLDYKHSKFGFSMRCRACNTATPWARLSTVARALWNRGDRAKDLLTNEGKS